MDTEEEILSRIILSRERFVGKVIPMINRGSKPYKDVFIEYVKREASTTITTVENGKTVKVKKILKEHKEVSTHHQRVYLRKYNLTADEIADVRRNGCQICGKKDFSDKAGKQGCFDHDHKTGKFRGFLCSSCNWGLGHFKDDVELMKKAITYLEKK